jgi:membrane-bound lytic murein transglycosylase MltF
MLILSKQKERSKHHLVHAIFHQSATQTSVLLIKQSKMRESFAEKIPRKARLWSLSIALPQGALHRKACRKLSSSPTLNNSSYSSKIRRIPLPQAHPATSKLSAFFNRTKNRNVFRRHQQYTTTTAHCHSQQYNLEQARATRLCKNSNRVRKNTASTATSTKSRKVASCNITKHSLLIEGTLGVLPGGKLE